MAEEPPKDMTPITIRMLEREYHANGNSIAASIAINEDRVWLPLADITLEFTGEIEANQKVVNITMPMWIAKARFLA